MTWYQLLAIAFTVVVIVNLVLAAYWYRTRLPPALWGTFRGRMVYEELDSAREDRRVRVHPDSDLSFQRANGEVISVTRAIGREFDGMSGAPILWLIIGSPFTGKGRKAWAIHDTLCALRDRPAREAHRICYEACQARGMWFRARLVYAGLLLGGSTW